MWTDLKRLIQLNQVLAQRTKHGVMTGRRGDSWHFAGEREPVEARGVWMRPFSQIEVMVAGPAAEPCPSGFSEWAAIWSCGFPRWEARR